ncbi:MAG: helix-turn-helix transcriptional regulator, partial [Actinomycetes bacterium]
MPVLGTKLHAPVTRRTVVARPRLTERLRLDPGSMPKLVLVAAPAGFGKTTLLAQSLSVAGLPTTTDTCVAWLSLDAADGDLRRFLTHLVAAVRTVDPAWGADAMLLVQSGPELAPDAVLTSLLNDVDASGQPLVVALDDYHVIDEPAVHEAITFLLDHLPARVTVAIATRADPPLPLSRLRARGELLELRAADLRFNSGESETFLNQAMGLDLAPDDVAALASRTEGWAAGLQLAALSARQHAGDPAAVARFVQDFTGSSRFVLDYLVDEVLGAQPDDVRAFLLQTSVLEQLTGPLCDALTGRTDGRRVLEELERANLFVVALDDQRDWFRYHHLFADALRAQLVHGSPNRVAGLHLAAARWYADRGLLADAIPHALNSADGELAADLVEMALPDLRRDRQDRLMRRWLRALPESALRRRPSLAIAMAWVLLSDGRLDDVESWLDAAETGPPRGPEEALRELPAMAEVYRASVSQARGDVAGTLAHARRALDLAGPTDHRVRG